MRTHSGSESPLRPEGRRRNPPQRRHASRPARGRSRGAPFGRALHILIARHRRGLAALLAAAAVWLLAAPTADDQAATTAVVTAARPLAGGARITASGLAVVRVPSRLVPEGALGDVSQAAGQTLVADRSRGSVLTRSDLLSAPRAGPGKALTGVRISDPALLAVLRVGQTVSVVMAGEDARPQVLAPTAVVRAIPDGSGSGALSTTGDSSVVVVSTDPDSAARIATHASSQGLGIVMM